MSPRSDRHRSRRAIEPALGPPADAAARERQANQLERDLGALGSDLDRLAALARRPGGQGASLAPPGCAALALELQAELARLLARLGQLRSAEGDRWEQRRLDLERGRARLMLVQRRLGAKLLQR